MTDHPLVHFRRNLVGVYARSVSGNLALDSLVFSSCCRCDRTAFIHVLAFVFCACVAQIILAVRFVRRSGRPIPIPTVYKLRC